MGLLCCPLREMLAGETTETELSQVKVTACVTWAVLFEHEGSDGLVQDPSKVLALRCLGAPACFALVTGSVGSLILSTSNLSFCF